jgi:hypothetical protein
MIPTSVRRSTLTAYDSLEIDAPLVAATNLLRAAIDPPRGIPGAWDTRGLLQEGVQHCVDGISEDVGGQLEPTDGWWGFTGDCKHYRANMLFTIGTQYEDAGPLDVALMTARQADLAATFNYASQAYNNHFFFETLVPDPPGVFVSTSC